MLKLNQKRQYGFTIVELLIVIVVIGILAALVLNSFSGAQAKARDAKRQDDLSVIRKALEAFHAVNGGYPDCNYGNVYQPGDALVANTVAFCLENTYLSPQYIPRGVVDPINTGSSQYLYAVGFRKTGDASYTDDKSDNYILGAKLETSSAPTFNGWGYGDMNYLLGSNN